MRLIGASLLAAGALTSLALGVAAQAPPPQSTPRSPALPSELVAKLERLRDAALISDYAWRQVAHLTQNIGPRLAGSRQAEAAVSYVADELGRLGLEVRLEEVTVPHWVRGEEKAELTVFPAQAAETTQKIVLTALGNSTATPDGGLTRDVVVVNDFDELAALGRDRIAGRIVLFNEKFDKRMAEAGRAGAAYGQAVVYRGRAPREAAMLGAAAVLVHSVGGADYRLPHTGAGAAAGIPSAAVTAEDADLLAHLTQQGRVVMHLLLTPQSLPDAMSHNVIADLNGSEHPEQIVIVSGHLDSWDLGTGAIDDAAGVAIAMRAAQLCKQLGLTPRRTLRVIAWMNEENGGSGSRKYVTEFEASLADHVGAIESDLGAGHPLGFTGTFSPSSRAYLAQIASVLAPIGATLVDTGFAGADVSGMGRHGVPIFGLMQDERTYFNYHHTAADTLDKIVPHELAENAAVMAVLGFALADMPEPLPRSIGSQ
jgi:Zn-dependent M28 family amino/carboxypeptidase